MTDIRARTFAPDLGLKWIREFPAGIRRTRFTFSHFLVADITRVDSGVFCTISAFTFDTAFVAVVDFSRTQLVQLIALAPGAHIGG